jgi:hypothetical protein
MNTFPQVEALTDRQELLEAACFYQFIVSGIHYQEYKIFSEWLGAYKWIPYPERKEILPKFAEVVLHVILKRKPITTDSLFMLSFYADFIQSYSINVQRQVISWILKSEKSTQELKSYPTLLS